ncbi:MAG: dissimilatory-type sulfite reductase subunit alpha [Deltaproteobacteria bacterium]|nr:dissimilatory-type sulfite reductase subunit alpha [Deltaproteobacteria bacterium]
MHKTPMLDHLESGPWPSFVKDLKRMAAQKSEVNDLLGQLERSYREKITHWKHGGIVGVLGYGSGIIGRYSDLPEEFPGLEHFHTMRINHPSAWFYSTQALRELCDIWDKHGSGVLNLHGSTGDIIFLGCRTEALEPCFADLTAKGWDIGGSGSAMRSPSCCVGPARCEWACYDTLEACYQVTQEFQFDLHRPSYPYKFKYKFSGCPNDCVAAVARADLSVIGVWKDDIRIDQSAVEAYAAGEIKPRGGGAHVDKLDIQADVVDLCPTHCMSWDGRKLTIDNKNCNHCMHCINLMPQALRPGTETGATILLGSHAPILEGAQMSWVIVPFMEMEPPFDEVKDLGYRITEWWAEHGKNRERVGELIMRLGMRAFLEAVELPPVPQSVIFPRSNPFFFWKQSDFDAEAKGRKYYTKEGFDVD